MTDKEALKAWKKLYSEIDKENWLFVGTINPQMVELAIKALENSSWIPVKTRELTAEEKEEYPDYAFMYDCKLPDDGEEVLVTTWGDNVALDTFCRDDGCYFENYCDEEDVIAWMPKPEPYKKEGKEGDNDGTNNT